MTKRKDPADFAQDSRSPFAMTGRICARRPGAAVRNGGSMKTELDSAWESAIHNAERARKAEAEVERLRAELAWRSEERDRYKSVLDATVTETEEMRAELAEAKKFKDGMLDVLGGACPNDHRSTPLEEFKGCTPCLRAELANLLAAIEAMRVAGGAAEFQRAFDEAKVIAARKGEGE